MTFQQFLEKIEKTKLPIRIRKVEKQMDKQFPTTEEVIRLFFDDTGELAITPSSVSEIKATDAGNNSIWSIVFKSKGMTELIIFESVDAYIHIPNSAPNYQTIKDKWEGWNCN